MVWNAYPSQRIPLAGVVVAAGAASTEPELPGEPAEQLAVAVVAPPLARIGGEIVASAWVGVEVAAGEISLDQLVVVRRPEDRIELYKSPTQ